MKPILEENFTEQLLKDENYLYPSMYELIKNMPVETVKDKENNVVLKAFKESKQKAEEVFNNAILSLNDTRTTKKDDEINLMECSATLILSNLNDGYNSMEYSIDYKVQLTDSGDNVHLEVLDYKSK